MATYMDICVCVCIYAHLQASFCEGEVLLFNVKYIHCLMMVSQYILRILDKGKIYFSTHGSVFVYVVHFASN